MCGGGGGVWGVMGGSALACVMVLIQEPGEVKWSRVEGWFCFREINDESACWCEIM